MAAALASLLIATVTRGSTRAYARAGFFAGIAAWAWLEIVDGVNGVRRAMGVAGLASVVAALAARRTA
jgi:hypothetical protein